MRNNWEKLKAVVDAEVAAGKGELMVPHDFSYGIKVAGYTIKFNSLCQGTRAGRTWFGGDMPQEALDYYINELHPKVNKLLDDPSSLEKLRWEVEVNLLGD